jgi:hypothetical protein
VLDSGLLFHQHGGYYVKARIFALLLMTLFVAAGAGSPSASPTALADTSPNLNPTLNLGLLNIMGNPVIDTSVDPPGQFHAVRPGEFDPGKTQLVQAAWLGGIGCPTNAFIANPNASFTGVGSTSPFTDSACPTGDTNDQKQHGTVVSQNGSNDQLRRSCRRAHQHEWNCAYRARLRHQEAAWVN